MALLGPNCIGFTNFVDGVAMTFEPLGAPRERCRRGVAVIAQSGAMTTNLRVALLAKDVAVASAVSTGNEAVTGIEDFLADALAGDATDMVVMFVEQVRRPALFLDLVRRARVRRIPIVMLHPGRTERARVAAQSHTGALAGDHAVMSCVLANEDVLILDTLDELFDVVPLMRRWPKGASLGTAILTNSGAFRGVALDFCAERGLDLPNFSPEVAARLKAMLPSYAAIDNPLDITTIGISQHDIFGRTAEVMLADPGGGSLIAAFIPGSPQLQMVRARSLLPVIEKSEKPVAFSLFGDETPLAAEFTATVREAGVNLFRSPDRAMRAMACLTDYGRRLARPPRAARARLPMPPLPGRGTVPEHRSKAFLGACGIAVPDGALVRDLAEAQKVAARLGYPVVLKAQSADLPHKSDAGGVILGIGEATAFAAAWERLHANLAASRPGLALEGVLVERAASPGLEMLVGARRDREWGPVLVVGLGGIWTEALGDVRVMPPDATEDEIAAELRRLKGAALLAGLRGAPPVDVRAVARVAATLGRLMLEEPAFLDIEINPLMVYPSGAVALDALIIAAA
jgi:acyl-CoA synthetase (NDP forming)